MKALTLIRPWCWAICHAGKDVENRGWPPPERVIGSRIAIHSGLKFSESAAGAIDGIAGPADEVGAWAPTRDAEWPGGRIVCTVRVEGWVERPDEHGPLLDWAGLPRDEAVKAVRSPWFVGPIAWVLRDVIVLRDSVPCRGAQGLWNLPADVLERVESVAGRCT